MDPASGQLFSSKAVLSVAGGVIILKAIKFFLKNLMVAI
jgi:hypothetical protein